MIKVILFVLAVSACAEKAERPVMVNDAPKSTHEKECHSAFFWGC